MGDFRIVIEAVGGHGCGRDLRPGQPIARCRRMFCPDCLAIQFVETLRRSGSEVKLARLEHWPVPGAAGTKRERDPGPIDNLLTGQRQGSFSP